MNEGLSKVPDDRLKALLRGLHRGSLAAPLTAVELARHGLQDYAEPLLGVLRGVEARGVKAVVVAVLAEREALRPRD
ncbi:MAG: hypothetical protein CSA66_04685 [Proteobacteria bacterium]|nr:MAG: hypothetical protein CSA66_04685 [Pseudomonadota bacterium]